MGSKTVKVAVDAMGGDYAPQELVKGAVQASSRGGIEVILVGPDSLIQRELQNYDVQGLPIRVVNASQVIQDGESPVEAIRQKPDASVLVATRMVKEGQADAIVSMGHTGAVMVASMEVLGAFEGIKRPSAGGAFCGFSPHTLLFDLGPNADCRPRDLLNFAIIGSVAARKLMHIDNPAVALLSNGSEEGKGNILVRKAYQLLKESGLNFIGNVEGNDIPLGRANVIVCDGFTGNVLVKFFEGVVQAVIQQVGTALQKRLPQEQIDAITGNLFATTHVTETGGLIYGLNGVVIIGHGRSKGAQIADAINAAKTAVESNIVEELKAELRKVRIED
jgi:phosphate acyltransferase